MHVRKNNDKLNMRTVIYILVRVIALIYFHLSHITEHELQHCLITVLSTLNHGTLLPGLCNNNSEDVCFVVNGNPDTILYL